MTDWSPNQYLKFADEHTCAKHQSQARVTRSNPQTSCTAMRHSHSARFVLIRWTAHEQRAMLDGNRRRGASANPENGNLVGLQHLPKLFLEEEKPQILDVKDRVLFR
jgi:trans-aconitate methyltransferase